jgi:peptidoglycan-N-acetylglucosamine deacetylase
MLYFVKTPFWLRKLYGECTWKMPSTEKVIYLTFDDGPHPEATPFVLAELKKYNARATFFCIGKNVVGYPEIFQEVINAGHTTGNHTYNHLNGWKTEDDLYLDDISIAKKHIDSTLFRPPYGRATKRQLKLLRNEPFNLKPCMWTVLSGDFDEKINGKRCQQNVIANARSGSIVVFHDSKKALERLQIALPGVLKYFSDKGYRFESIIVK